MIPHDLDPSEFRRPRDKRPTRHVYLANCGQGCGDSTQSVLEVLDVAAPDTVVEGLHVGIAGVSYASFATADAAERICGRLADVAPRWVVRYAELPAESQRAPLLPSSVASTVGVDVPGLELFSDFVSESEAQELLAAIDACPWDTSIKRRVQHYGHAFDYARLAIAEDSAAAPPQLPEFSAGVVQRLTSLGRLPHVINQLTINEYLPGIGIASHCDAHSAFEEGIVALSLGSGIVMEFRCPETDNSSGKLSVGKHHRLALPPPSEDHALHKNVWLPANSLLIMRGEARYAWQHGIAWRKTDCIDDGRTLARGRRVSMTFRTARHKPCDCQWPMLCNSQNPSTHVLPSRLGAATAQLEPKQHEDNEHASQTDSLINGLGSNMVFIRDAVEPLLQVWGSATPSEHFDLMCQRWPALLQCGVETDIKPRLAQVSFLVGEGVLTAPACLRLVVEQPRTLSDYAIQTLWERDGLIAVHKPFDMRIDLPKGERHRWPGERTVADWFEEHHPPEARVRFCNQLDHATSGVLLLASTKAAGRVGSQLFQDRRVEKYYLALVLGHPPWQDEVQLFDRLIDGDGFARRIAQPGEVGEEAETHARVVKRGRWPFSVSDRDATLAVPAALLEVRLMTGRRHQIRVQLAAAGHPILGDATYGGEPGGSSAVAYRTFLHAHRLRLPLGHDGAMIEVEDPCSFEEELEQIPEAEAGRGAALTDLNRSLESGSSAASEFRNESGDACPPTCETKESANTR